MRSAATFAALMITGVLIVMIYIWSGESLVALVLAIITLFLVLGMLEWRPWVADSGRDTTGRGPNLLAGRSGAGIDEDGADNWLRGTFDITWDDRGISGVAVGSRAPQLWSWAQIDQVQRSWCQPDRLDGDTGQQDLDRYQNRDGSDRQGGMALRLAFPNLRKPVEPEQVWLLFGPTQDALRIEADARAAWRESRAKLSRLYDLTADERTWSMAEHFTGEIPEISDSPASAELLYQEVRRLLVQGGWLHRITDETPMNDLLDALDGLLAQRGAEPISRQEAEDADPGLVPNAGRLFFWSLDEMAEKRGYRTAFVEQRSAGGATGDRLAGDLLLGLVPASMADDWDGQTVGSGSARVVLDLPESSGRSSTQPGHVLRAVRVRAEIERLASR